MARAVSDEEFLERLTGLFLAEGISSLTVGEIAKRMHCSRRRLYGVAQTKEELFYIVVARLFQGLLDEGEVLIASQQDVTVTLADYLNVGLQAAGRMSAAFLKDIEEATPSRSSFDAYQQARALGMAQLIDRGVNQGVFVPCHGQVVAETILGAALRLRRPTFLTNAGLTMEEAFQELYRVLLGGLLVDADNSKTSSGTGVPSLSRRQPAHREGQLPSQADDEVDRRLLAAWNRP